MKVLSFLISLILAGAVCAAEPQFPAYSGFVNDYAGVLDAATKQKIEGLCQTLEKKTSAELAVAVVKTVAPLDPKTYAVKLFEKWKIGKKGKDNGLLILLAMEEKRIEIEVGYGLEGVINDAKAGEILDKYVVPFFKEGKFGAGVYNGAEALAARIATSAGQELGEEYQPTKQAAAESDWLFILLAVGLLFLFVVLSAFASGLPAGVFGALLGSVVGFFWIGGLIGLIAGAIGGFVISYTRFSDFGGWSSWGGGSWGGGGGGGFGGFGGGGSGGGGSGRSW